MTYLDEILKIRSERPNMWVRIITHSKKYLSQWLDEMTPKLQTGKYKYVTKLYWVKNGLTDFPVCKFCENGVCPLGKDVRIQRDIDDFDIGYFRACTHKCPNMLKIKTEKCAKTVLSTYGSSNYFTSEAGKKKRQDWFEKNGITNAFQLESVKEKSKKTRLKNFGYEYTMQSPEKRKMTADRYEEKTGYRYTVSNPDVIAKGQETRSMKKEAGIDLYVKHKETNRKKRYQVFLNDSELEPLFSEDDFLKLNADTQYTTQLQWRCKKCGSVFTSPVDQNWSSRFHHPARCFTCYPEFENIGTSREEKGLIDFVKSITDDKIIYNSKSIIKPLELDAYIPDHKLAIEYNGLFYHSEMNGCKDKNYHLTKTVMCSKSGIRLIHIFEDQWLLKNNAVKAFLSRQLSNESVKPSIVINRISNEENMKFQDDWSLLRSVNSDVSFGIYDDSGLRTSLTFVEEKEYVWTIVSICSNSHFRVENDVTAILNEFEKQFAPDVINVVIDRSLGSNTDIYDLGFIKTSETPPDFLYVKSNCCNRRYTLDDLKGILDNNSLDDVALKSLGYDHIFDCGKEIFTKVY